MPLFNLVLLASDQPITPAHIERLEKFCDDYGLTMEGEPQWATAHQSVRIPIHQCLTIEQVKAARVRFQADRMDILCLPVRNKPYKLLLADMDATIVTSETLDELAGHAGIGSKIAAITARAMNGELNFEEALRERVALLAGLPERALQETLNQTEITPGAADLIKNLKAQGCTCVLVSGGFTFFTGAIAKKLGFDHHHGNTLLIENGKLTGAVGAPILNKDAKLAFLKHYTQELGIDLADTIAIGDGANDLPMLAAAGLGLGWRAKPVLEDNLINILHYARMDSLPL